MNPSKVFPLSHFLYFRYLRYLLQTNKNNNGVQTVGSKSKITKQKDLSFYFKSEEQIIWSTKQLSEKQYLYYK